MTVVVTGGTGGLGREIMAAYAARGIEAQSASRRTGFDLTTGVGVPEALRDADVVVHAATHKVKYRRVDLDGTRRMIAALSELGRRPHLVYISIVGCDQNPQSYYRAKTACEIALRRSGLPVTVVRATQFHDLVYQLTSIARWPLAVAPGWLDIQPCERRWVAERVVESASAVPPDGFARVADLAGPERLTVPDAVTATCRHRGRRVPRMLSLPVVGAALAAMAAGTNLPGPAAELGGRSYPDWLAEQHAD
jgi:uncharacterized protein YbjT (DUF2867 family)